MAVAFINPSLDPGSSFIVHTVSLMCAEVCPKVLLQAFQETKVSNTIVNRGEWL